jgi:dephospho-CoA kinase
MLRVGLTGGIGSGKSTVSNKFNSLFGVPVIDADVINRSLLKPGSIAHTEIKQAFGDEIITGSGEINRKLLREKIFSSEELRKKLENILHPKIRREISSAVSSLETDYCLIVIPLLIESQLQSLVDRILVVDSSQDRQIERVSKRDNCSKHHIRKIISAQTTAEQRLKHADDIIINDGDPGDLDSQIEKLHNKYLLLSKNP